MPKQDAGAVQFDTHVYVPAHYSNFAELEAQALPMLLPVRRFAGFAPKYPTFIGEWTLSMAEGGLSLEEVAKWWYREAAELTNGVGLAVWNYDGGGGWGALAPINATARTWWKAVNKWPH